MRCYGSADVLIALFSVIVTEKPFVFVRARVFAGTLSSSQPWEPDSPSFKVPNSIPKPIGASSLFIAKSMPPPSSFETDLLVLADSYSSRLMVKPISEPSDHVAVERPPFSNSNQKAKACEMRERQVTLCMAQGRVPVDRGALRRRCGSWWAR